MKFIHKLAVITAAGASLILASCSGDGVLGGGGFGDLNLYSVEDDKALGEQVDQEIRSDPQQFPILNNPQAEAYVQGMIDKILLSDDVQYKDEFAYDVTLIDNDSVINAFCTPGGFIYVYTGIIKFLPNEAALAGVLGHEVAHAEERHSTERMTTAYGIQVLLSIALGENPSQLENLASNLFANAKLLQNSRNDEFESDELSFEYLQDTEYYPAAITYFFDKVGDDQQAPGFSLEQMFATHPDPDDREAKIKEMAQGLNEEPNEGNLFTTRYQQLLDLIK
ncbi:MAG: M48 family metalloprotease [Candidatus Kapaibacteriales bacterium]